MAELERAARRDDVLASGHTPVEAAESKRSTLFGLGAISPLDGRGVQRLLIEWRPIAELERAARRDDVLAFGHTCRRTSTETDWRSSSHSHGRATWWDDGSS